MKNNKRKKKNGGKQKTNGQSSASAQQIMRSDFDEALQLHKSGQWEKAEKLYEKILAENPEHSEALHLLGVIYLQRKRHLDAFQKINQSVKIDASNAAAYSNLGVCHAKLWRIQEAISCYNAALKIKENFPEAWNNLASAYHSIEMLDEAKASYEKAIAHQPDYVEAINGLCSLLWQKGEEKEAVSFLKKKLESIHHSKLFIKLAQLLYLRSDYDGSNHYLDLAQKIGGEMDPDFHHARGVALSGQGDFKNAVEAFEKGLELDSSRYDIIFELSNIVDFKREEKMLQKLENKRGQNPTGINHKVYLNYSLAKAYNDLERYDESMYYLHIGSATVRNTLTYDPSNTENKTEDLIHKIDKQFIDERKSWGRNCRSPIFILGMPRSGTTLVEQIISSHGQVDGLGELTWMETQCRKAGYDSISSWLCNLDKNQVSDYSDDYLRFTQSFSDSLYITDKMPGNYWYLPLIRLMFPRAAVIHCQRNPIDTCLSCYQKRFSKEHKYSYELDELARYYRCYYRLMKHWRKIMPGYILDIRYEDLVKDQEKYTRKLLHFIGLDWDENCLQFHRQKRHVHTASSTQVRKKIYRKSVERWRNYEPHIRKLVVGLEDVVEDYHSMNRKSKKITQSPDSQLASGIDSFSRPFFEPTADRSSTVST